VQKLTIILLVEVNTTLDGAVPVPVPKHA